MNFLGVTPRSPGSNALQKSRDGRATCLLARFRCCSIAPWLPFRWRKLAYLFGGCDAFLASQLAVKVLFPDSDVSRFLVQPTWREQPSP
jgi:hypothetical protein